MKEGNAVARDVVLRLSGTSGVAAILTPLVGVLLAAVYTSGGYSATVPVLVAIGASYLIGGYVAVGWRATARAGTE